MIVSKTTATALWSAARRLSCNRAYQAKANYERHAEKYRQQRVENYRKQKAQVVAV